MHACTHTELWEILIYKGAFILLFCLNDNYRILAQELISLGNLKEFLLCLVASGVAFVKCGAILLPDLDVVPFLLVGFRQFLSLEF